MLIFGVDGVRTFSGLGGRTFARIKSERVGVRDILIALLTRDARSGLRLASTRSRSAAGWRRRRRCIILEIVEVVIFIGGISVSGFNPSEGNFLNSPSRDVDFDAGLCPRLDAEWALVRLG